MKIPLEPDKYYHIFNHANGRDNIFANEGNYEYFLRQYLRHISPIEDTLAYCLMPNHFHIAIRIKSIEELIKTEKFKNAQNIEKMELSNLISKQFSNFFSSYTLAFNKQQNRMGSLFIPNFSRKHIDSNEYLINIITYIHLNPIHHEFTRNINDWKHSTFQIIKENKPSFIKSKEVIDLFDDIDNFLFVHYKKTDNFIITELEK